MDLIWTFAFFFILISHIYLSIKNANMAENIGKSPTIWGGLSFLLSPIGSILISNWLRKESKKKENSQKDIDTGN
jgi:hypothetical protein